MNQTSDISSEEIGGPGGPLLALALRFQLPSSCYATMLIRELTKQSTTKDFQVALSAAAAKSAAATTDRR